MKDRELYHRAVLPFLKEVKSGRNGQVMALCPFHDDHKPSLSINTETGLWRCFGCGAKGNAIQFYARLHNISEKQARRKLVGARSNGPQIVAEYNYYDESGKLLYQVVRKANKEFFVRRPDGNGGWKRGRGGQKPVLYRLNELARWDDDEWIFIPEGEKDVDRLISLGLRATCNPSGAGKWRDEFSKWFRGKRVVILPDADNPGLEHARQVARSLAAVAKEIRVLKLPDLRDKEDVSDWLDKGHTREELLELVQETPPWAEEKKSQEEEKSRNPSQKELLIRLAEKADLFLTVDKEPFADIFVNGHRETHPIGRHSLFRNWLLREFFEFTGRTPGAQVLNEVLDLMVTNAIFKGREAEVFVRVAEHNGNIYIDLCDKCWQAIEITPGGWRVAPDPPVRFRRAKGMLPLPMPDKGGDVNELRRFINVARDDDFLLILAWLTATFRPTGPYPVLVLHGEQGTAKSTVSRVLRELIDPNSVKLRTLSSSERDLIIAAKNNWILAFDNISRLPGWLSDAFCRLATGGGFGTRALYTDADEVLFDGQRPIIMNGIGEMATRSDLVDRAIFIHLPRIEEGKRKPEQEFWREFNEAKGRIFGALLNIVSRAMAVQGEVELNELPRMADFAKWGTAIERALEFPPGSFMRAYGGNREDANNVVLEASPVATAIQEFLHSQGEWEGTATELLNRLNSMAGEEFQKFKNWPKNPRSLSRSLHRLAPNLRSAGIDVQFLRSAGSNSRRIIKITENIVAYRRTVASDSFNATYACDDIDAISTQYRRNIDAYRPESPNSDENPPHSEGCECESCVPPNADTSFPFGKTDWHKA